MIAAASAGLMVSKYSASVKRVGFVPGGFGAALMENPRRSGFPYELGCVATSELGDAPVGSGLGPKSMPLVASARFVPTPRLLGFFSLRAAALLSHSPRRFPQRTAQGAIMLLTGLGAQLKLVCWDTRM